ncbi:MAG: hypothetical protein ACI4SL_11445 [Candidatus Ornithospirochaeta sp.]
MKRASSTALLRYPYFKVRLVSTSGGYDIVPNDKEVRIVDSSEP